MKVYVDTSVFGGVFDEGFAEHSRRFFEETRAGKFELVVSALVEEEIASALKQVRRFFDEFSPLAKIAEIVPKVLILQRRLPERRGCYPEIKRRCDPCCTCYSFRLRTDRELELQIYCAFPESP